MAEGRNHGVLPPPLTPEKAAVNGRKMRLATARDVRVFVARVLRDLAAAGDFGDPERARVALYGAQVLRAAIETSVLEKRLRRLEEGLSPDAPKADREDGSE